MKQRRILLPLMILLLFLLFNISYAVDVTECQEINESGYYELINDVNGVYNCFVINTSNVEFNCNGYVITTGENAFISYTLFSNITIYNCIFSYTLNGISGIYTNSSFYNLTSINLSQNAISLTFSDNVTISDVKCYYDGSGASCIDVRDSNNLRMSGIYSNLSAYTFTLDKVDNLMISNSLIDNDVDSASIIVANSQNLSFENITVNNPYGLCYSQDGWGLWNNISIKNFNCILGDRFSENVAIDIIISKNIMLDNVTVLGSGTGTGIVIDSNEYVTMKDLKLSNLENGISLIISSNNTSIINSDFTDISAGCINLGNTLSNVSVIRNNFTNCIYGIRTINFDYLDYLLIENNTFNSNRFSVYLTEDKISEIHVKNNEIKMYSGRYGILINSDTDVSYVTDNKVFLNTSLQQNPFYFDIEKYYNLTFKDNVVDDREYLYYYDNCPPIIDLSGKSGIIAHCNDTIIRNLNGNSYMTYGNNVTGYNIITNNCRMCLIVGGYNQILRDSTCNDCLSNQVYGYDYSYLIRWINVSATETVYTPISFTKEWYVNIRTSDNSRLKIYVDNEYKGISPIMLILPQKIVNITGEYDISNHSFKAEGKGYKSELEYYVIDNNKDIVLEVENVVGVTTYQVAIPIINNIFIIFLLLIAVPILYKVFGKELMILYLLILVMVVLMILSVVI